MSISSTNTAGYAAILLVIRRILLALFLLGVVGAAVELLLLGHTEDTLQWVPLLLFALGSLVLLVHAVVRRAATVRVFQLTMILFVISGFVGCYLHYRARVELKLETNPALAGWQLFREAITGGTVPPVLAPGMMIQLGLLGLAYTYRHPALIASVDQSKEPGKGEYQ